MAIILSYASEQSTHRRSRRHWPSNRSRIVAPPCTGGYTGGYTGGSAVCRLHIHPLHPMQQSVGAGSLLWMPFRCDNALETLSWVGDDDDDKKKNITELVEVVPAVCLQGGQRSHSAIRICPEPPQIGSGTTTPSKQLPLWTTNPRMR